jgi:bacteriocin-like protein
MKTLSKAELTQINGGCLVESFKKAIMQPAIDYWNSL